MEVNEVIVNVGTEALSEYDDWAPFAADKIWYKYESAPYEGSGCAVLKDANGYRVMSLSHCSCGGPLDGTPSTPDKTLGDLRARMTKEYLEFCSEVFAAVERDERGEAK
jgi:hypothetical protein